MREVIARCQGGWVPAILIPVPLQLAVSARRNPVRSRPQFRAFSLQATNGEAAPSLLLLFWVRSFPRVQLRDLGAAMFTGGSMDGLGNTYVGLEALVACGTTTRLLAFLAACGRLRSACFAVSAVGRGQDRTGQDQVRPAPPEAERRLAPLYRSPPKPSGKFGRNGRSRIPKPSEIPG